MWVRVCMCVHCFSGNHKQVTIFLFLMIIIIISFPPRSLICYSSLAWHDDFDFKLTVRIPYKKKTNKKVFLASMIFNVKHVRSHNIHHFWCIWKQKRDGSCSFLFVLAPYCCYGNPRWPISNEHMNFFIVQLFFRNFNKYFQYSFVTYNDETYDMFSVRIPHHTQLYRRPCSDIHTWMLHTQSI